MSETIAASGAVVTNVCAMGDMSWPGALFGSVCVIVLFMIISGK